jgi:hypothetical protein
MAARRSASLPRNLVSGSRTSLPCLHGPQLLRRYVVTSIPFRQHHALDARHPVPSVFAEMTPVLPVSAACSSPCQPILRASSEFAELDLPEEEDDVDSCSRTSTIKRHKSGAPKGKGAQAAVSAPELPSGDLGHRQRALERPKVLGLPTR